MPVTQIFSGPSGDPADLEGLTEDEQGALASTTWFQANVGGYHVVQGQQPQTLAHALSDSPVGFLGWAGHQAPELLAGDIKNFFEILVT